MLYIPDIPALIVHQGFLSLFDSKPDTPSKSKYSQIEQTNKKYKDYQDNGSKSQRIAISSGAPLSFEDLQFGDISIGASYDSVTKNRCAYEVELPSELLGRLSFSVRPSNNLVEDIEIGILNQ